MKKRISFLIAALIALGAFTGCTTAGAANANTVPADDGKLHIVTTIFPPYDFVREIAGEHVTLTMLLPPGAESHSFEPSPQDIITIQNCDVFLYVGGESDAWLSDILTSMDTGERQVLALLDMVDAQAEVVVEGMQNDPDHADEEQDEAGHDHDEEEAPELDEHVWTSPQNAKRIVQAIADALCALDENNADAYMQNTTAYLAQLDALDAAFEEVVAGAARHTIIFGDRFPFRYLADTYGLTYYAAFPGCSTETEPSAATVAFLIDKVKEESIPVVFTIEMSNQKMADTICGETGAQKRLLHSCHNVTQAEMDAGASYLSLMTQNVEALKEALQ